MNSCLCYFNIPLVVKNANMEKHPLIPAQTFIGILIDDKYTWFPST
jgi:hypothetical protein